MKKNNPKTKEEIMKIYTFLNDSYEIIETVKATDYESSLKKVKSVYIDIHTPYYSENLEDSEYFN